MLILEALRYFYVCLNWKLLSIRGLTRMCLGLGPVPVFLLFFCFLDCVQLNPYNWYEPNWPGWAIGTRALHSATFALCWELELQNGARERIAFLSSCLKMKMMVMENWLANVAFLPLCFCFSFPSSLISGLFFFFALSYSLSLSVLPSLCFSFCQFSFSSLVLGVSVFLSFVFVLLVCLFSGFPAVCVLSSPPSPLVFPLPFLWSRHSKICSN